MEPGSRLRRALLGVGNGGMQPRKSEKNLFFVGGVEDGVGNDQTGDRRAADDV